MENLIKDYMNFLDNGKTERRCVNQIISLAEKAGYKNVMEMSTVKAGDKVYYQKMGKAILLFEIGSGDFQDGMNILGAHIDSPRLDAKQNPIYEHESIVYLNTHYYGGIKKYQWLTLPLAINGFVFTKDGKCIDVNVGDEPSDPVFCISDILIHCAQEQLKKNAAEFIEGEKLDVIIGSANTASENKTENTDSPEKNSAKKNILAILKNKYGFEEDDLASAELEIVPAGKARYLGFDNNLVIAYGQDDRVCAYTSLAAMLDSKAGVRTNCCIFTDKEEIGSYGASGMSSHILDNAVAEIVERLESNYKHHEIVVRRALSNSFMLSSDVNAAYDPLNENLYDKQNSSFLGGGLVFNKYTGSRGKSGASDANPEFIAKIRKQFDRDNIKYQHSELAKVDVGGGGTIAHYAAEYGLQVIDAGVAVLNMHAPWEITSTYDIKQAYLGYKSFLQFD